MLAAFVDEYHVHFSQQSLTLKSNYHQMLKVRLQIRGNSRDFQLQTLYGHSQKVTDCKDVVLKPHEEYPIHVLFAPSRVAGSEARLQIKPSNTNTKYTVSTRRHHHHHHHHHRHRFSM